MSGMLYVFIALEKKKVLTLRQFSPGAADADPPAHREVVGRGDRAFPRQVVAEARRSI